MAHNALHDACHKKGVPLPELWAAYQEELSTAEEKAAVPA
jgi:hypothetical protein